VVVVRNHSDGTSRSDEMVPMGIYVFSPSVLEMIPTDGYQDIKESLIPKLYAAGLQVGTYVAKSQAPRVTGADAYMAVNDWAVQRLCAESTAPPEHSRLAESWVHQSASIHPSARLIGPVLIGASAIIGRGACIVGPTSVGSGSRIEADTVICRSAIWDDCSIGVGGNVDRCIVAHHAHIDDGAALRGTVTLTEQARLPLLERVQARWPKRLALGSAAPSEPRICKPGFAA